MFVDQYKGFFDWRGNRPDQEPRYGVFYAIVVPAMAGLGLIAWLGWTWPALLLTLLAALIVWGVVGFLAVRRYRREESPVPEWR